VSTPCRSHRPARLAILTAADAVRTLAIVTDDGRLDCCVLACVDESRMPLTLFTFDGAERHPDVVELALELLLSATSVPSCPLGAVFLGSSRPRGELGPTAEDEARWWRMADACADAGIELLDWFLLSRGVVCSVAQGLDPGPGW
jgi:hypothetical protein